MSADGKSLEIAIPRSLLTPAGGRGADQHQRRRLDRHRHPATQVFLPSDYTKPEYTITDPATLLPKTATHRVAIVYSDTSANLYFSQTAYSDLFMAAQNQARMAGVSYDVIDESQLTNINNLIGYDALIFPAMADVNTAQLPAIMSTLTSAVYNYHIGIITSGDFLTNDQTGARAARQLLRQHADPVGSRPVYGRQRGTVTVTANDVSNPIMQGYTAGQVIQTYANRRLYRLPGRSGVTADVLVNQNVTGVGTLPGVVETTTGGTNVHFATADLLGDSNLLSHAIQSVVLGTQPASRCTRPVERASWRRAWTWTSRSSPRTCRRLRRRRHLRQADTDPAAVEHAIQFRRILLHQHRRQPAERRRSVNDELGEEPALLQSHPGDGRRDRQPLLHTPYQSAYHDVHGAPPSAIRRPARLR